MQRVHYFQRFSKPEDVATNCTLLLLKRIQHHDPRLFQGILQLILSADDLVIGAVLTEQETTKNSIVDGVIRQQSFHVVVETKRHASFPTDQLQHHLDAFKEASAGLEVLLLLGKQEPANFDAARSMVAEFNAKHKKAVRLSWTTFAHLIEICRDIVPEHERETIELIDDFEDFCDGEGLLASSDADLLVVGCSQSLVDNLDLNLYYDPKKSHRPAKYIGFYHDKAVRAIGLLSCIVRADLVGKTLKITEGPAVTAEHEARIKDAMNRAPSRGWNITRDHYFFIASEVERTKFRKTTKYPLWNRRYFDLREVLKMNPKDKMPDLKTLAKKLCDATW
jgi:hypothetical protein